MTHNPNPILLIRLFFWLGCISSVVISLIPAEHLSVAAPLFTFGDKILHASAFTGLCLIGSWAYLNRPYSIMLGLLVLGGSIELVQFATGWRQIDFGDFVANAVG